MFRALPCHGTSCKQQCMFVILPCSYLIFIYLYICRSLGDAVAHTAGVISTPEFTTRELNPESDKFLIVATDGLWEFVDNKETVDMADSHTTPSEAVDSLVKEASLRWMREEQVIDDTTVIVANLFGYKSKE